MPSLRPQFWNTLQGSKKPQIVSERVRFAQHLAQMGFGHLEGFKISKRTKSNEVANDATYHTEDELLHLAHGNRERVDKIIAKALADGPGLGCGYFQDPRLGETVRRACCASFVMSLGGLASFVRWCTMRGFWAPASNL